MISVAEAKQRVLADLRPGPVETVSLTEALGRVLAEPIHARHTRPAADTSAMDGYAVRAGDPGPLTEIEQIPAGQVPTKTLGSGECSRIFTGAYLPEGADAILIQEDAVRDVSGDQPLVTPTESVMPGAFVRQAGRDFSEGQTLLGSGKRLGARDIALLASANRPWVTVRRRPRIAILATGDEIVFPGEPVGPGQIVGAGSHSLAALVKACGGDPVILGVAPDKPEALELAGENARGCDFLVTIGGASVGDYDLVHDVLGKGGLNIDFQKIAMRPGKPLMFGSAGDVRLLGLPGNPVSSYVCGLLFLRPAIDALLGCPQDGITRSIPTHDTLPANGPREHYMRARTVRTDDGVSVQAFEDQDSSLVKFLAQADVLIVRPVGAPAVDPGGLVPVVELPAGPTNL